MEINVGDMFDVFVEEIDSANGETKLSREKCFWPIFSEPTPVVYTFECPLVVFFHCAIVP